MNWFRSVIIRTIWTLESSLVFRASCKSCSSESPVFVNSCAKIRSSSVSQQGPQPWLWKGPLPSESWFFDPSSYTAIKWHLEWKGIWVQSCQFSDPRLWGAENTVSPCCARGNANCAAWEGSALRLTLYSVRLPCMAREAVGSKDAGFWFVCFILRPRDGRCLVRCLRSTRSVRCQRS